MADTKFAVALKEQLLKRKAGRIRGREKQLLDLLNEKPSRRRTRRLERLERHARVHLFDSGFERVSETEDWEGVAERDWDKFFDGLLEFLKAILPIILTLFA